MALIVPGPMAGQISGRLGSTVFSHNKGGPYVRNGTIPTTSYTAYALAAKARLSAASSAWQSLTAGQRGAWKEWGIENPVTNRVGHQITLTGISAFAGIYTRLTIVGQPTLTAPPIDPAPQPLTALTLHLDIGPGAFDATFTPTPTGAAEVLWLQAAITDSPAVNNVNTQLRLIGGSGAAVASPFDFQDEIEARLGALVVDQTVNLFASIFSNTTGLLSQPLRATGLVTDTT